MCRARLAEVEALFRQIRSELHDSLDQAQPGPRLDFAPIAAEWRRPPQRVTRLYRAQQLVPSVSTVLLLGLFALALLILLPTSDTAALRSLELVDSTTVLRRRRRRDRPGVVVVRLEPGNTAIVKHLAHLTAPRNLQFSPDGAWLALRDGRMLHILQPAGSGAHVQVPVRESANWSWSPDSLTLAYTDGTGQLALFDTRTQTNRVLVPSADSAWGQPVWTGDSQQIAYAVVAPLPSAGSPHTQQSIWRVTLDTDYRIELARNPTPQDTLLVPSAWIQSNSALLAWDANAGASGKRRLYRVDVNGHGIAPLDAGARSHGTRLAWPVGPQDLLFAVQDDRLVTLDLQTGRRTVLPVQLIWPSALDWAPTGAWISFTVAGMPDGEGLYLYAPGESTLLPLTLPDGANERAASLDGTGASLRGAPASKQVRRGNLVGAGDRRRRRAAHHDQHPAAADWSIQRLALAGRVSRPTPRLSSIEDHLLADRLDLGWPQSGHIIQVVQAGERSVLLAVIDHRLRQRRPIR